jgi:hypothetical protein
MIILHNNIGVKPFGGQNRDSSHGQSVQFGCAGPSLSFSRKRESRLGRERVASSGFSLPREGQKWAGSRQFDADIGEVRSISGDAAEAMIA